MAGRQRKTSASMGEGAAKKICENKFYCRNVLSTFSAIISENALPSKDSYLIATPLNTLCNLNRNDGGFNRNLAMWTMVPMIKRTCEFCWPMLLVHSAEVESNFS